MQLLASGIFIHRVRLKEGLVNLACIADAGLAHHVHGAGYEMCVTLSTQLILLSTNPGKAVVGESRLWRGS